jgi:hypothetical protein
MKHSLIFKLIFLILFASIICIKQDPFDYLGIPSMNTKMFESQLKIQPSRMKYNIKGQELSSIEDLPNFLEKSNLSQEEGVKVLSKFLLADDYFMKKYGAVFDKTGFDGLPDSEPIAPPNSPLRIEQRAKSAAQIWVNFHLHRLNLTMLLLDMNHMELKLFQNQKNGSFSKFFLSEKIAVQTICL